MVSELTYKTDLTALDYAELFSSAELLKISDHNIFQFEKQLTAAASVLQELAGVKFEVAAFRHKDSVALIYQNLSFTLAKAKARSAMSHHYLGKSGKSGVITQQLKRLMIRDIRLISTRWKIRSFSPAIATKM